MTLGNASIRLPASLGILLAIWATPANAQGTAEQRSACMSDAFRLCYTSIPNEKRIEACLRSNRRSLSTDCRREIFDEAPSQTEHVRRVKDSSTPTITTKVRTMD